VADGEVAVQVSGTVIVDVDAMVEEKVQVQVGDVVQCSADTVGTPQEVQGVEVHLSKAAADRVH